MDDETISPLLALAISMAYEIRADTKTTPQEKGRLAALFGKLVEMESFHEGQLHSLINQAFSYARENSVEEFLLKATPNLSSSQRLAIIANLYDTMQTDGHIRKGEEEIVQKFEKAFDVDQRIGRGIKRFLMLKNDTSLFLDVAHPLNNNAFDFDSLFVKK